MITTNGNKLILVMSQTSLKKLFSLSLTIGIMVEKIHLDCDFLGQLLVTTSYQMTIFSICTGGPSKANVRALVVDVNQLQV